jgi:hypothetical protein
LSSPKQSSMPCGMSPGAMHTAHDEHHFQLFFIFCELPGVPLLLLRDNVNMSTATAFLYFDEVFAIPNLSKQLKW